ncbi:MAG: hypothetical protein AB4426_22365 [Xenococcaceae cyanobacterium]
MVQDLSITGAAIALVGGLRRTQIVPVGSVCRDVTLKLSEEKLDVVLKIVGVFLIKKSEPSQQNIGT